MANDTNQCNFIGRLGNDPEMRYMPNGGAVVNMRLAVGSQWKDQNGQRQERTEWVPLVAFGKLAEICGEYLRKGSQIYVSGKFQTREWEKDGVKRYSSEIIVDQMQMLGDKGGSRGEQRPKKQAEPPPQNTPNRDDGFDDDIPF